ncbi:unnamed protein product, partial [marine sediment metagenome]
MMMAEETEPSQDTEASIVLAKTYRDISAHARQEIDHVWKIF